MNKQAKAGRKHVHVPSVIEAAQTALVYKLGQWLQEQPEWPLLFLNDRQTRRRTARLVINALTTIPSRAVQTPDHVGSSDPLD